MFFYFSFLRPPPVQAAPYGTISITPQISNDLRTEPFEWSHDLFFSWSLHDLKQTANPTAQNLLMVTKPVKLTTWRPSSAYKEIPVPIPTGAREGQSWRLILTGAPQARGQSHPECIDLGSSDVGRVPFPVMSMPILFNARGAKGASKQERIERAYLLPLARRRNEGESPGRPLLRFIEQTSFDLDKKIWDSGIGLGAWLCELSQGSGSGSSPAQEIYEALFSEDPRNIVELGAGIGIVSIALATLRSNMGLTGPESMFDHIFATDVSSAMPLLEQNITANAECYSSQTTPQAMVLDWDDEELPEEIKSLSDIHAIVMADVTYNTSSFPSLLQTLLRLVEAGSKPPLILFGYKERDAMERTWFDITKQAGIEFEKIGERGGVGGAPVEVWVGRVAHV